MTNLFADIDEIFKAATAAPIAPGTNSDLLREMEESQQRVADNRARQDNQENMGDFKRGLYQGKEGVQGGLYGAVGIAGSIAEKAGFDKVGKAVKDWGFEGYNRNEREASLYPTLSFDDVDGVGSTVDYIQGIAGTLAPSMGEAFIGSALGGGVGYIGLKTASKKAAKELIEQQIKKGVIKSSTRQVAEKKLENELIKQSIRPAIASASKKGMVAAVTAMEAGSNYGDLLSKHGVDAPFTSLAFGALAGAMETMGGNIGLIDEFVGAIAKKAPGAYTKRLADAILKNVPAEALQEAGQEVTSILNTVVNTDEKLLTPANMKRIFESGIAGAIGGGMGAPLMAFRGSTDIDSGEVDPVKILTGDPVESDIESDKADDALDPENIVAGFEGGFREKADNPLVDIGDSADLFPGSQTSPGPQPGADSEPIQTEDGQWQYGQAIPEPTQEDISPDITQPEETPPPEDAQAVQGEPEPPTLETTKKPTIHDDIDQIFDDVVVDPDTPDGDAQTSPGLSTMPEDTQRTAYIINSYRGELERIAYANDSMARLVDRGGAAQEKIDKIEEYRSEAEKFAADLESQNPWVKEEYQKEQYQKKTGPGLSNEQNNIHKVNKDVIKKLNEMSVGQLKRAVANKTKKLKTITPKTSLHDMIIGEIAYAKELIGKRQDTQAPSKNQANPKPKLNKIQQTHIDNRVAKLGSIAAVDKEYSKNDKVSEYARAKAREIYPGEVVAPAVVGLMKPPQNQKAKPKGSGTIFASRLRGVANGMQKTIDAKLNSPMANQNPTRRRAGIIAGMTAEGERLQRIQKTMGTLADMHEDGTVPEKLAGLRTKAQMEMIDQQFHRRAKSKEQNYKWNPSLAFIHKENLNRIIEAAKGRKGVGNSRREASNWLKYSKNKNGATIDTPSKVKTLEQLIKALGKDDNGYGLKGAKEALTEAKRYNSLGISSESELVEFLDEYGKVRAGERVLTAQDKVKSKERELLGTKIPGFFPTPKPVIENMMDKAGVEAGMSVLEPSAGKGDIADAIKDNGVDPDVIELSSTLKGILDLKGHNIVGNDFLEHTGEYDRIIMNPPFEKGQDIDHVKHAYSLLKPGGKLVSIMSEGPFFNSNKKGQAFREWLEEVGGTSEKLEQGSFKGKDSFRQTGVNGRIVEIGKSDGITPQYSTLPGEKESDTNKSVKSQKGKATIPAVLSSEADGGEKITLYHGSIVGVDKIDPHYGVFGPNLFFSPEKDAALSHGEKLYQIDVSEDDIIDRSSLFYEEDVESKLSDILNEIAEDYGVDIDTAMGLLDESEHIQDVENTYDGDIGEADWELQVRAGEAAEKLGYKAISMEDEHGTSYMVNMLNSGYDLKSPEKSSTPSEADGGGIHEEYKDISFLTDKWKKSLTSIREYLELNDDFDYGVRAIDPNIDSRLDIKIPSAGEKLPNSFEWDDGNYTENEFDGTAVFLSEDQGVVGEELPAMFKEAFEYFRQDDNIRYVVVRGEHTGHGGMPEEHAGLLVDAEAVAVLDKNGNILDSIIPEKSSTPEPGVQNRTTTTPSNRPITPQKVEKYFKSLGLQTGTKDGKLWVRTPKGLGFTVETVDRFSDEEYQIAINSGAMDKNGHIAGNLVGHDIKVSSEFGDKGTLFHELLHLLENAGILTKKEVFLLTVKAKKYAKNNPNFKLQKDGRENRANFMASVLNDREQYRGTTLGKILQKVADFIDALIHIGRASVRKVARGMESGTIYNRDGKPIKAKPISQNESTAGVWYSQMENFLEQKLSNGPASVIKNQIQSWAQKGQFKQEELEWSGVLEWLDEQKGKVKKQDVLDFLKSNRVEIREVEKGSVYENRYLQGWTVERLDKNDGEVNKSGWYLSIKDEMGTPTYQGPFESKTSAMEAETRVSDTTKYSNYQIPGGKNYKELLLGLPVKKSTKAQEAHQQYILDMGEKYGVPDDVWASTRPSWTEEEKKKGNRLALIANREKVRGNADVYKSAHWDEKNVLAHVRMSDRIVDGQKILHIEEIQSDWQQDKRKKPDSTPSAPWKKTWPIKTFQRMVRYAAENGYDSIAWTEGQEQANRYSLSPHIPAGRTINDINATTDGVSDVLGRYAKSVEPLDMSGSFLRDVPGLNSSEIKSLRNRASVDSKSIGNLFKSEAFMSEGFSGLDVPSQRLMASGVLRMLHESEIRNSVVKFIPIDMVDNFSPFNLSSKMGLHNPSVLLNSDPIDALAKIATSINMSTSSLASIATFLATIDPTTLRSFNSGNESVEGLTTGMASDLKSFSSKQGEATSGTKNIFYRRSGALFPFEQYAAMSALERFQNLSLLKDVNRAFHYTSEGKRSQGMKAFYDQILPTEVNKFFGKKAWGKARVGEIEINADGNSVKLHAIPITEQMRSKAIREGMPLYSTTKNPRIQYSTTTQENIDGATGTPTEKTADTFKQVLSGMKKIYTGRKDHGKDYVRDINVLDTTTGLLSHYSEKVPGLKKVFNEILRRPEYKYSKEMELTRNGDQSMMQVLTDLKKSNKIEYKRLNKYLIDRDINAIGNLVVEGEDGMWNVMSPPNKKGKRHEIASDLRTRAEAVEKSIENEASTYKGSPREKEALQAFRGMSANLYDHFIKGWNELIAEYEKRGLELPEVATMSAGKEVRVSIQVALKKMGDRTGYYFPRQRDGGDWRVVASKPGARDIIKYTSNRVSGRYLAGKLEAQGYSVEAPQKVGSLSEDIFKDIRKVISTQSALNQALSEVKIDDKVRKLEDLDLIGKWDGDTYIVENGGQYAWSAEALDALGGEPFDFKKQKGRTSRYAPGYRFKGAPKDMHDIVTDALFEKKEISKDITMEIGERLAEMLADTLRARGSQARMIARSEAVGIDVPAGYEEDMTMAMAQAVNSAAGGYAKQQVALKAGKAITGRELSWDEYKPTHPDGGVLQKLESDLEKQNDNSPDENARLKKITQEITELQQERLSVSTESQKNRASRLEKIRVLYQEQNKIRKWKNKDQAIELNQQRSRLLGGMSKDYRVFVLENMIDPKKQKIAHEEALSALENVLRNDEAADRVLGTLKGLASVWFLGGKISSATINLTSMGTSVPASMKVYGGIPIRKTAKHIAQASKAYMSYKTGKGNVSAADRAILDEIESRGWIAAQLNMETINALKSGPGKHYSRAVELLMAPFKITEEFNRATTQLAAYKGVMAENPKMSRDNALKKAKEVSDKAHGIYGKENQPTLLRKGKGLSALSSMYIFQTYIHNYFSTLAQAVGRKEAAAATYMILSPVFFGGAGATVLLPAAKMVAKILGADDPEEDIYKVAESLFGETGSDIARYGIPGALGVSLKGSLAPNLPDFSEPLDILGPIGGMIGNIGQGMEYAVRGDGLKAAEKLTPGFIGNMIKGYREATDGITTRNNTPVYFGRKQVKGDTSTGLTRALGFNPTKISKPREIQWNEETKRRHYNDKKRRLYAIMKKYILQSPGERNHEDWMELLFEAKKFNNQIKEKDLRRYVSPITPKSIKQAMRTAFRPKKSERNRKWQ